MDATETRFPNVDLDLYSSRDLQSLIAALGKKVIVLHYGRPEKTYEAHFELPIPRSTADVIIRKFCALIERLPKAERDVWNTAKVRDFNIGIEAGTKPLSCEFPIAAKTIQAVAAVGARVVVTVYAPPLPVSTKARKRSSASSH